MNNNNQFGRKLGLVLYTGAKGIDLSEMQVKFHIQNADVESPNNAVIRVYNLAQSTVDQVKGEYSQVSLQAGYENGNYGVIFQGSIKQFRVGKENAVNSYLDILAADGDIGYNQGIINQTIAANTTPQQRMNAIIAAMPEVQPGYIADFGDMQHIPQFRGKILFGMARSYMRDAASSLDASWSIQNGKVQVIPLTGYLPGTPVKINIANGLIGLPEQTDEGLKIQCLLNSALRIGGLVQLNNAEINQLMQQNPDAAPIRFDQYTGFQHNAPLNNVDGMYRAFVVEHEGDTRGREWYSNIICLAVKPAAPVDVAVDRGV